MSHMKPYKFKQQSEIDRILDKVNAWGLKSLTSEEMNILQNPNEEIKHKPLGRVLQKKITQNRQQISERDLPTYNPERETPDQYQVLKFLHFRYGACPSLRVEHNKKTLRGRVFLIRKYFACSGEYIMKLKESADGQDCFMTLPKSIILTIMTAHPHMERDEIIIPFERWLEARGLEVRVDVWDIDYEN
jgi:hypothetical protein